MIEGEDGSYYFQAGAIIVPGAFNALSLLLNVFSINC